MSAACSSYLGADGALVEGFSCPRPGNAIDALFCCGFNDVKYCCDDPNSFFPYEYRYMWWLSYSTFPSTCRRSGWSIHCSSGPSRLPHHRMRPLLPLYCIQTEAS
uniref:Shisa like 2A n=1 Tax=Gasterosteus aculeatus TaxID=69293 RepID=G3PUU1_GASAC